MHGSGRRFQGSGALNWTSTSDENSRLETTIIWLVSFTEKKNEIKQFILLSKIGLSIKTWLKCRVFIESRVAALSCTSSWNSKTKFLDVLIEWEVVKCVEKEITKVKIHHFDSWQSSAGHINELFPPWTSVENGFGLSKQLICGTNWNKLLPSLGNFAIVAFDEMSR